MEWVLILLLSAPQGDLVPYTPMSQAFPLRFETKENCVRTGKETLGVSWTLVGDRGTDRGVWGYICVRRMP